MATLLALGLVACGQGQGPDGAQNASAPAAATSETATAFPASLKVVGNGYPKRGDACRVLGESAATIDWLADSATLVGCTARQDAEALGGKIVGEVEGIVVVSMPMGSPRPTAVAASTDPIRGEGGLEDKCKAAVEKQGTTVVGTNRIEESEAAIEIYVNVRDGTAPWRCLGNKNGTIGDVMFTGDEGAL